MPDWNHPLIIRIVTMLVFAAVVLTAVALLIMLERKVSAWVQDRLGPNRTGPKWAPSIVRRWGIVQAFVDGIKMVLKEDIIPAHVDRFFYLLAPAMAMGTALLAFAVVPFGPTTPPPTSAASPADLAVQVTEYQGHYQGVIAPGLDIGILFTFAVTSLAVYGIVLAGWSAHSKYSLLGGLRSSAQLISYEIPLGLSVVGVVLLSGSLNLEQIVSAQIQQGWFILYQPLAFFLFLTGTYAECNRVPFDLPECEQELVGGYHTEYSSLKFGMFFLGEYTHLITTSFLAAVLFLGGWHFPFADQITNGPLKWGLGFVCLFAKVMGFIMLSMLVRWTIPRFRFDQLMGLAWQVLIPIATLNLLAVVFAKEFGWPLVVLTAASAGLFVLSGWFATRPMSSSSSPPKAISRQPVLN